MVASELLAAPNRFAALSAPVALAVLVHCQACTRPSASVADAGAPVDPVQAVACDGRAKCRLESQHAEPPTAAGDRTVVALVSLGRADANPRPPRRENWLLMGRDRGDQACIAHELWLLRLAEHGAQRVQLLASACTRDIHETPPQVVDIPPARIRFVPEPSDDSYALEFALDPPALALETFVGRDRTYTWMWPSFRGQVCSAGRCVPGLPDVDLGERFARGEWKTTSLGACSMLVDRAPGETSQGVVSGGHATAAMRLLLSGETLYVEVSDDVFIDGAGVVDTLDVGSWFTQEMTGERGQEHHRVRMNGQVTDGGRKSGPVDVATGQGMRRFALPAKWVTDDEEWSVTYEDTDDGNTYASKLSTGPHEMPPPVFWAPGACTAEQGSLRVVPEPPKGPETPLFP